jgi:predicted DNA binding protein
VDVGLIGDLERHYPCIRALIRLDIQGCPLSRVARCHSDLEFRIQEKQMLPYQRMLASLAVKQNRDADGFFIDLNSCEEVRALSLLYIGDDHYRVRIEFECDSCMLFNLNERLRISSDCVYYKSGGMVVAFFLKSHEEFRGLLKYLKEEGVDFQVLEVKKHRGSSYSTLYEETISPSLTPKQLEILRYAYRSGYFDRDRKVNLKDIAEHFGLSPATVGVHMRAALKKILKNVI